MRIAKQKNGIKIHLNLYDNFVITSENDIDIWLSWSDVKKIKAKAQP